jgi:hypothetical protein
MVVSTSPRLGQLLQMLYYPSRTMRTTLNHRESSPSSPSFTLFSKLHSLLQASLSSPSFTLFSKLHSLLQASLSSPSFTLFSFQHPSSTPSRCQRTRQAPRRRARPPSPWEARPHPFLLPVAWLGAHLAVDPLLLPHPTSLTLVLELPSLALQVPSTLFLVVPTKNKSTVRIKGIRNKEEEKRSIINLL